MLLLLLCDSMKVKKVKYIHQIFYFIDWSPCFCTWKPISVHFNLFSFIYSEQKFSLKETVQYNYTCFRAVRAEAAHRILPGRRLTGAGSGRASRHHGSRKPLASGWLWDGRFCAATPVGDLWSVLRNAASGRGTGLSGQFRLGRDGSFSERTFLRPAAVWAAQTP